MNAPATAPAESTFAPAQVREAAQRARASGRAVVEVLQELSGLTGDAFVEMLGQTCMLPVLSMAQLSAVDMTLGQASFGECVQRGGFLTHVDGALVGVLADPFDLELQAWIEARAAAPVAWRLVRGPDLVAYFAMQEGRVQAMDSATTRLLPASGVAETAEDLSFPSIEDHTSPVIRLVQSTIYDAMKAGASDIHIETSVAGLQVKYRLDGVLTSIAQVAGFDMAEQVVSRIKVMADLDIAERRVPQDGRFALRYRGHEVDYRVSVMPNMVCEDVVIRVLDKRSLADEVEGLSLERLGFDERTRADIRRMARQPYGMLLVTGPTGSGKTTTMYAALSEINDGNDKIITIEDPVEYELPGVLQIPVNERKGLTFARGLRSILRHDPDKILVGEIRDPETAQIAIQSALTGHLVFTSVHANNVFDVLGRFLHMGVDAYSFVSALNGIVAQRLLRTVCPQCAAPCTPTAEQLEDAGISSEAAGGMRFRTGAGCGHCRGTGYKGRHAVGEVLRLNDHLRELIVARAPISAIKAAARESGTRLLRDAALELVVQGHSTLEELNRVTFAA